MEIYHGTAIAKENIGDIVKKGDGGIITAYLPEMKTFAIFFGDGKWYTFNNDEEWFLKYFEVVYEPKEE
jgi:hypothetical protein